MTVKTAIEFSSPEALKNYLHEHPKADPHKHTVKKTDQPTPQEGKPEAPPAPDGHGEGHDDGHGHEPAPKKTWKEVVLSLSAKAKSFVDSAPKAIQKFVTDDAYQRKVLMAAHTSLVNAPASSAKKLLATAKHEIHEFQEAGGGVKAILTRKKLTKSQKHAMKTVAFHVGLTIAATALTTSGLGAGAAVFAKSMARHVALKAVGSMFEKLHILDELGHVGHGIQHIMDKLAAKRPVGEQAPAKGKGEADPELAMVQFVQVLIAETLKGIDAEDIGETVEKNVRETNDIKMAHVLASQLVTSAEDPAHLATLFLAKP